MDDSAQATVTRLLSELQDGKTGVVNELFSCVYFARMRAGEFQKTLSITLIE